MIAKLVHLKSRHPGNCGELCRLDSLSLSTALPTGSATTPSLSQHQVLSTKRIRKLVAAMFHGKIRNGELRFMEKQKAK
jgi:hypothetical protein